MAVMLEERPALDLSALYALRDTHTVEELEELACKAHLGIWTKRRRGLEMSALHTEWCELRMDSKRLAVVAPREHAKSETFTVNGTAWESIYKPGIWTYVFAATGDQSKAMLGRIREVVEETARDRMWPLLVDNKSEIQFANGSTVNVAGAGKAVRGAHPDVIVGDDVLEEASSLSSLQRRRVERWWLGTVAGMCHPGTRRGGKWFNPTRVYLVGTPFHKRDLLLQMKENPMYRFRRYAGEFRADQLVDGLAVEVA